jgi:hypothetical protein
MALLVLGATLAPAKDARFLVSAPHTKEECLRALDEINATGKQLLDRCDFGCMAGDHTTYVVLEAKDVEALRKMLPPSWSNARLVKLNKFTPEQIASFHKRQ